MRSDEPSIGDVGSIVPAVIDEPVFREPWEAQAFAMTVLLHERGLFTWGEWAQALGAQIAGAREALAQRPRRPMPTRRPKRRTTNIGSPPWKPSWPRRAPARPTS